MINVDNNDKKVIDFIAPKKTHFNYFSSHTKQQFTPYIKPIGGGLAKGTVHMRCEAKVGIPPLS